jgi:hypothetical protein
MGIHMTTSFFGWIQTYHLSGTKTVCPYWYHCTRIEFEKYIKDVSTQHGQVFEAFFKSDKLSGDKVIYHYTK